MPAATEKAWRGRAALPLDTSKGVATLKGLKPSDRAFSMLSSTWFQVQDFTQPTAGEQQQLDRRRVRPNDRAALALANVLRIWFRLVHGPRDPGGFRLADRRAKP
jgi:hypothetical protein